VARFDVVWNIHGPRKHRWRFAGTLVPFADIIESIIGWVREQGLTLKGLYLADTVDWADPLSVQRCVAAVRTRGGRQYLYGGLCVHVP
jgi:hypothetical protein